MTARNEVKMAAEQNLLKRLNYEKEEALRTLKMELQSVNLAIESRNLIRKFRF
jgi:cell fate (sporulation/competence/biofilm development) regulator YmcA (YheA/YmcA/DUF963 family)